MYGSQVAYSSWILEHQVMTPLGVHKKLNKMIDEEKSMNEYVKLRSERDAKLRVPRFIHPSLQVYHPLILYKQTT